MQIVEIENEANSWKVDDAEVWYHTQKSLFYCWSCGDYHCEHVAQLRAHLTPRAADGAMGFCKCGYMAKYPICTKCGRAYPPRR